MYNGSLVSREGEIPWKETGGTLEEIKRWAREELEGREGWEVEVDDEETGDVVAVYSLVRGKVENTWRGAGWETGTLK